MLTKETGMTKAKTKMPKLPMSPTEREWDQYYRTLVQYQKEQLARKDAKIAALEREVKRLKQKSEKDWEWFHQTA
jgi:tRNA(Phe) wybutosine-synthesizing methylase Tyw3